LRRIIFAPTVHLMIHLVPFSDHAQSLLIVEPRPLHYPQPALASSPQDWIKHAYTNCTLVAEIQCYSLPYSGIGFACHILTYYTMAMLVLSRHSYYPWRQNTHSQLDRGLGIVSLVLSVVISALTRYRCRSRWQFIAIAAWKLDLSVTFGILCYHSASLIPISQQSGMRISEIDFKRSRNVLYWLILYIPRVFGGLTGLFS
jgi:hypothetical protein